MPRRQFIADLNLVRTSDLPPGILEVRHGDDDGQLEILCVSALHHLPNEPVRISALIPDLSDYPKYHRYMVFAADDAPPSITNALEAITGIDGRNVPKMLEMIASALAVTDEAFVALLSSDTQPEEIGESANEDDSDDESVDEIEIDYDFQTSQDLVERSLAKLTGINVDDRASSPAFQERITTDLAAAKHAGFKVGHLGGLRSGHDAFVTISIRMSKLGISAEAMQAWQVEGSEYLILLIRYQFGYKTNEELQGYDNNHVKTNIRMRVLVGQHYKPTLQEAIAAISSSEVTSRKEKEPSMVRDTFISQPLCRFFEDSLIPILRYRGQGLSWLAAEISHRNEAHLRGFASSPSTGAKTEESPTTHRSWPEVVVADHYSDLLLPHHSFPLLAAQFMLRHFVRCTEFCLVCHRHLTTEVELEALKPYVCDSPLCLYQYMSLGFGPSIEHEIMTQPYVVDLLVSLCYSSAAANRLKDLPNGLSFMVPSIAPPSEASSTPVSHNPAQAEQTESEAKAGCDAMYDEANSELVFKDEGVCPVRVGQWLLVVLQSAADLEFHCRVTDPSFYPRVSVSEQISLKTNSSIRGPWQRENPLTPFQEESPTTENEKRLKHASVLMYDQHFDDLTTERKHIAICKILDTLPSVSAMRQHLLKSRAALKSWLERISPPALSLLRWIIASNRACLMQVDGQESHSGNERLYGMGGYFQFRFVTGAPDKEQRFMKEVQQMAHRRNLEHPTIFAFHGSPLYNWHMIIREGLHYKNADHGRAYGDGVYHAKDANTSTGYSRNTTTGSWPGSVLCIQSALALNELVNAPSEYKSSNPYYVVQHLDWIQTRFLFVKLGNAESSGMVGSEAKPKTAHPQDSTLTPTGVSGKIIIPASAVHSLKLAERKGSRWYTRFGPAKKRAKFSDASLKDNPEYVEEPDDDSDAVSVMTDLDDRELLRVTVRGRETTCTTASGTDKQSFSSGVGTLPGTDFVPGTLSYASLPIMPLPEYANSPTTRRLMKELLNLRKTQESSNLSELGWYINVERIENAYQWIVELHSFHNFKTNGKPIPLATDMANANVTSIVMEIRFNNDFPFSPPYIRVVRPRFLPISQGGGGHVVMGGAMCMELLTNTGWSSVSSMESVLMQVRMAIASEPHARLENKGKSGQRADYGVQEAADGYLRAVQTHGWQAPPGFRQMAYNSTRA